MAQKLQQFCQWRCIGKGWQAIGLPRLVYLVQRLKKKIRYYLPFRKTRQNSSNVNRRNRMDHCLLACCCIKIDGVGYSVDAAAAVS